MQPIQRTHLRNNEEDGNHAEKAVPGREMLLPEADFCEEDGQEACKPRNGGYKK
jgi:hypothetical protein